MIRVLVVEDSAVERELLIRVLDMDSGIHVVGTANNGEEAIRFVKLLAPDVVTMDIHMPLLDGIEATRRIMEEHPVPIIIVSSSYSPEDTYKAFTAVDAGALMVVKKPAGIMDPNHRKEAALLRDYVKLMSEIRVIRRMKKTDIRIEKSIYAVKTPLETDHRVRLIAIGASTGGPGAIEKILSGLSGVKAPPILIVQHMIAGFIESFGAWLQSATGYPVCIASDGETLECGKVYLGPDNCHLTVTKDYGIKLTQLPPVNGLRPSVSSLFVSVAQHFGSCALGILLTGMGNDGSSELKLIRDGGGITVVQECTSCVVNGMPGEAFKLGSAQYIMDLEQISALIATLKTD